MLRGAPLPLLPLPVGAVGGKRPRLDDFNPVEDEELGASFRPRL